MFVGTNRNRSILYPININPQCIIGLVLFSMGQCLVLFYELFNLWKKGKSEAIV